MREKVKEGYEEGDYEGDYREDRELQEREEELFQQLFDQIKGQKILDLGCGTGLPFDKYLVNEGFDVTGLDLAEKHVKKARENVPDAEFIQGGFFEKEFEESSFDSVVSFYAIFHIPREEHSELLEKIRYWLKDSGSILITLGAREELDDIEGEIGGQEMFWSAFGPEKNKELVEDAGFEIIDTYIEDWRDEHHFWILAKAD